MAQAVNIAKKNDDQMSMGRNAYPNCFLLSRAQIAKYVGTQFSTGLPVHIMQKFQKVKNHSHFFLKL